MNRYRHFGDDFDVNNTNSAAILPEANIDEPFELEFTSPLPIYSTNINKFKSFFKRRTILERYLCILIIFLLLTIANLFSLSYKKFIIITVGSKLLISNISCIFNN